MFAAWRPAMRSLLERMARAGHPRFETLTPERAKAAYEIGATVLEVPKAPLAQVQDLQLPARDGTPLRLRVYHRDSPSPELRCRRCCCTSTAAASRSAASPRTTRCAASCARSAAPAWHRSTTGSRPSTVFRPPCTTPRMRCTGCTAHAADARHGSARASRSAATARAARWPRSARSSRATPGLPIALQLLFYPGCARAPGHRLAPRLRATAWCWSIDDRLVLRPVPAQRRRTATTGASRR